MPAVFRRPNFSLQKELGKIADGILDGAKALIYGITEGYAPLIEIVEKEMRTSAKILTRPL
ncbi:MAG: hypothetical protein L6V93_05515 [Clostridiales bacterium]|nr:MAG: hypothetical protein L6V93_05515 [Clostridiales bacterium]